MSTRRLIIAALVCGMLILIAGAVQLIQVAQERSGGSHTPSVTTLVR
jgi:hypothetical protein